jgi:hypothetical protein
MGFIDDLFPSDEGPSPPQGAFELLGSTIRILLLILLSMAIADILVVGGLTLVLLLLGIKYPWGVP